MQNNQLKNVEQAGVLPKEDLENLVTLSEELQETFLKTQVFRTRTEMEISVLNDVKFPTPSLKYWQAVREQNVMFTELIMLSYEYRKNQVEIKKLERDIAKEEDDLERELLQIELEKKTFISYQQKRVAHARAREIKNWSEIKAREAQKMNSEELEDVDSSQLLGYTRRWINQAILMGNNGSPAERQNLLGQLKSGLLACKRKGLLDKAFKGFPSKIRRQLELL